jgi:hypothetical protein
MYLQLPLRHPRNIVAELLFYIFPDFIYSVSMALCCSSCSVLLSTLIYADACDLMICYDLLSAKSLDESPITYMPVL